ncbi:MAG: cobalt ECF transporter T component CbiQ [Planctomycetes bacterium]|nr:cobalt ECF transporter T component CbiQ [Planctomycetota bacterium]
MRGDFERHSRIGSPVHRLRPGTKLGAAVAIVVATVVTPLPQWPVHAGAAAVLVLAAALSRVPPRALLRRLLWLEPFVLGLALLALLQPGGLLVGAALLVRSTLSLATMVLLAATTPFADLLAVLRRLRVPRLLVTTIALMYRYLFVLADEAQRLRRARQSRTFTASRRHAWRSLATVVGQLFVRATARAERIYAAMVARGYR